MNRMITWSMMGLVLFSGCVPSMHANRHEATIDPDGSVA